MNANFWRGRKVFITGHTGFKGSWLCMWLKILGAEITGYSLDPYTKPNLFDLAEVEKGMTSVIGDIRDLNKLKLVLIESSPEIIIHMAAQPLVKLSYVDPVNTYSTNVMGTVNLFEAARFCHSVRAIVNVTTDKCYENKEWSWGYRENDLLGGFDPYSNSKACSEFVTNAYRNSFFNPIKYSEHGVAIATARAGNVIGGGDWSDDRLIPDLFKAFEANQQPIIRAPNSIRPWQYVLEPLSGYLELAEKLYNQGENFSGSWNFGPAADNAKSVGWLVEKIVEIWNGNVNVKIENSSTFHETNFLKLDISKSLSNLDWKPKLNLIETLQIIVEWEKARLNFKNVPKLCMSQIINFHPTIT